MAQRKKEKTISVVMAVIILCLCFCDVNYTEVGASLQSPLMARLLYSFFHANIFHTLINLWCFLSIMFVYKASLMRLLFALAVAVLVPDWALSTTPTVGLSCVCYALLGSYTFEVQRKLYYLSWMTIYLGIGFFLPGVNAMIHLYAYFVGFIYSLLFSPICKMR